MKPVNIAITIILPNDEGQSIWANGARQHAVFLYQCLKKSPIADKVWLVHDTAGMQTIPSGMLLDGFKDDVVHISSVLEQVDLLIEVSLNVGAAQAQFIRDRGGKVVSYRVGNDYYFTLQNILFDNIPDWVPNQSRTEFDEVWTNAQHAHTCKSFFEVLFRSEVHILPHIWSPYFIEKTHLANPVQKKRFGYTNRGSRKTVAMFEPNINAVKCCLIPMLAVNEFYREYPDLLQHCYITNALHLGKNKTFNHLISPLDMNLTQRATVEGRFPFPEFAGGIESVNLDIIITHQWENGLNYFYYDALYGNYPLVHNSPFLKDIGYYYEGFEIQQAAKALHQAATEHDANLESYNRKASVLLASVDAESEENVRIYTDRIKSLFAEG